MKLRVLGLMILIGLTGCNPMRSKMKRLDKAMTRQEVIRALGRPDGLTQLGEYEALHYTHRFITMANQDRADYYVILKNNSVIDYGTGEIRVKDNNVLIMGPLYFK